MNQDANPQAPAASSPAPATLMLPTSAEYRATGKMPETTEEPAAAAKEPSESAPESDTGEPTTQEPRKARGNGAETRLKEILEDLKRAGLTPAELKSFKREAQRAAATEAKEEPAKPEVAKPEGKETFGLTAPKRPEVADFESYDEFETAKETYYEQLADYRAELKLRERDARAAAERQQSEIRSKIDAAAKRYGDGAADTITATARTIAQDQKIPAAVKALLDESPVLADLMYTIGSKEGELSEFITLAQTNPAKAIRQAVLMEKLIEDELAKGSPATETERDETGRFTAPARKVTKAPAPPAEASARAGSPGDDVERAVAANDFRRFRDAQNQRDLKRAA